MIILNKDIFTIIHFVLEIYSYSNNDYLSFGDFRKSFKIFHEKLILL